MARQKKPSTTKKVRNARGGSQPPAESAAKRPTIGQLRRDQKRLASEILALLNQHATISAELGQQRSDREAEKRRSPGPTTDEATAQIERLATQNPGPLTTDTVRAVFRELASGCRELERSLQIAYLGPEYSYSHLAAIERFGTSGQLVPVANIGAVFDDVSSGNVDYGLVPLENSTDGRIADTLDMFAKVRVKISDEVQLRIHHTLLGLKPRSEIKVVCSKPQALSQCRGWLANHLPHARLEETTSTTAAAERAAREVHVAAIASRQAGTRYGLEVLASRIEDNKNNITRFAVIGQSSAGRTGNDKTSMLLQLAHQPGALADAMAVFKRNRLNLTWIESFPMPGLSSEYLFFVELQGHETDLRVRRALAALAKKTELLEVLGSYASRPLFDV